ncbi:MULTISPECIES: hypothetical protein [unclassified Streptomyces]|uniref:hypothetical protein n=1 Tax=unclassified Streptomyces TaxID=2593676 RepID=UPI00081EDB4C|nr:MULTISPECIES: hypothetical protein [unclassified Streptomyces]MYZ33776.1 hypothetical protein [Streptomyces sp. SID4917]SCF61698.1 hypothetical protein GA0115259_100201 [Streptomyces sp. MnatMP-M17]
MTSRPRWCHWHEGLAHAALPVQGGPPGYWMYACPACRDRHKLAPLGQPGVAEST